MKIQVDKEGLDVLQQLFDIALRSGGINNFKAVTEIQSIVEVKEYEDD